MRPNTSCADPAEGVLSNERLRWFTGRFLTARDLTDEQKYHIDRRHLHNRLFHGSGVVCGLGVSVNERSDCDHEWIWVDAGIAIDCLGREIIMPCRQSVHWPVAVPPPSADADEVAMLCIRYSECLTEPLPAIVDGCCDKSATQASRIVERWTFEVHVLTDDPDDCWAKLVHTGSGATAPCRDDCDDPTFRGGGCLEPDCECGDCVPIALLRRCGDGRIRIDVDECGSPMRIRRLLPPPPAYLTHIVSTSWDHGAEISIEDLIDSGGELRVCFDRTIDPGDETRTGVNTFTFVVEIEDSTGNRERLRADPMMPPRVDNGCEAIFTIDREELRESSRRGSVPKLVGDVVYVTVYGDLIHDCHGLPVDADFFGAFPSGDGVKGGVFRSWFFVGTKQEVSK